MSVDTNQTITHLLEQIISSVHPLMAEGLYLAAIPPWFNAEMFAAMRQRDDGRNAGLIERINRYSFVEQWDSDGAATYTVRDSERRFLQRHWIANDAKAYREAHRRALAYWEAHPDPNRFAQAQNRFYHMLFVDLGDARDLLVRLFRAYRNERQLAAIERLLDTAVSARFFLAQLESPDLETLDDLLDHLQALLAQMRGRWEESRKTLDRLRQKTSLSPRLRPFVVRAYAQALAQAGQFVEAINQYELALSQFEAQTETVPGVDNLAAEKAFTRIYLGDAYTGLAITARGHDDKTAVQGGLSQWFTALFYFFLSLPLLIYLTYHLGWRVWRPRFWLVLGDLDWIIARLFALGAEQYEMADDVLEEHGDPAEGVAADERLAYLYLALGDVARAETIFSHLLAETEAPLSDYRRASVQVGLGEALFRLGDNEAARAQLDAAVPVLRTYEDTELQAQAEAWLAETWHEEPDTAVSFYRRAQTHYQAVSNLVHATTVNERWRQLVGAAEDGGETAVDPLPKRRYRSRYRHQATVYLKRGIVILLAIVIFLIPLSVIRLETGAGVQPEIAFNATPLLQQDRPDFTPNLSQGVSAVTLSPSPNPELLIWVGLALFAGYLILATLVGLFVLAGTDIGDVQAAGAAEEVGLDEQGVQVGKGDVARAFSWEQITHYLQSGVYLGRHRLIDETAAYLMKEGERPLRIGGATAWYEAICRRLEERLPGGVRRTDFTYSILRSRMGILYGLTLLLLLVLSVLGQVAADLVVVPLPSLRYSLAALYPFLYLGLFLPTVWWFVIQPLRIRRHTHPHHPLPWWLGGLGVALLVLRGLTLFRPWLTVPDIYPSLTITILLFGALAFIWMARDEKDEERVYAPGVRLLVSLVVLAGLFVSGAQLWRNVRAYHYQVQGDYYRWQALQSSPADSGDVQTAIDYYSQAINIAENPVPGVGGWPQLDFPLGIPKPDQTTWLSALNSRAALLAEQGDYAAAVADYDTLLTLSERQADVYVSRAVAYQGWGTQPGDEPGEIDVDRENYALALQDFNQAIELDPEQASYYLWRGVAYHALGQHEEAAANYEQALTIEGKEALDAQGRAQAYTGRGWIAYSRGDYDAAANLFQKATEAARTGAQGLSGSGRIRFAREYETLNDALLGLGYTYYSLRQYDEALQIWEEGVGRTQDLRQFIYDGRPLADPIIYNSLATLYWRLGTLGDDYNAGGAGRCSASIPEEAKEEDAADLAQAVQLLEQASQIPDQRPAQIAFNYRTQGQVNYLLRNCPGHAKTEALRDAYESYEKAVRFDPDNAHYWYRKGRLAYSVWVRPGIPDSWLEQAIADMGQAIARDEDAPIYWYDRAWMRYNLWNNAPANAGVSARRPLFDGLADIEQALEMDPNPQGSYDPRGWYNRIRNEAINGTLSRGDAFFAEGDYRKAREYYRLVASEAPQNAAAAFKTGLAELALGNEAEAERWYQTGLERVEGEGAVSDLQTALLDLQTLSEADAEATVAEPLTLLSGSELAASAPETAQGAFALALLALQDDNEENAAALYHQGVLLAAAAGEEAPVIEAAETLADYLTRQGDYGETAVYWPLSLEQDEVYADTADLAEPARYWRYRAQFGLNLGLDRFLDGRAAGRAYDQIAADIERATELDPAYEMAGTFDAAFLALQRENLDEMTDLYHQGTLLAAEAGEMAPVEQAAFAWRDYLGERPELEIPPRYWPLRLEEETAETDAADLEAPDRYWRYRAEYGFEVTRELFIGRSGQEEIFAEIYRQLIDDIQRAYRIDPEAHRTWRDFFVDANLGWHYLRRGDSYLADDAYQAALADYTEATRRIRLNSRNAQNDRAEATFKAGLTALRLDEAVEAERWYSQALFLVRQYDLNAKLEQAIEQLADFSRETESPVAAEILERLETELESRQ